MSRFFSVSLVIDYDYYVAVYQNVTFVMLDWDSFPENCM